MMKTYHAAGITLAFPENVFDRLDRTDAEHVIRCYIEEHETYQAYAPEKQARCLNEFLDQIRPRGSCWSIV